MTLKESILEYIGKFPGATDTDLERTLGKRHQAVNQACRSLEKQGKLKRQTNPEKHNLIGNYPAESAPEMKEPVTQAKAPDGEPLQEEDIKHFLYNYLTKNGWEASVAWGRKPGVDIDARKDGQRWMIEVKGPGSLQPMRVNYFLGILGETLQRMDDPDARYTIALPDMDQYRSLWNRLPRLAKERTTIDMLLIDMDGNISEFK